MTNEELKAAMQVQFDAFKTGLNFTPAEELKAKFAEGAKASDALKAQYDELKAAAVKQGEDLTKLKDSRSKGGVKSIVDVIREKKDQFEAIAKSEKMTGSMSMELKALDASSFTNNTAGFHDLEIGEIAQGMPFAYQMLKNSISVPAGNQGSVDYWYQGSPTNNAGDVAENGAATASEFTWTRASLAWKRINANTKVSIYQLNDMNYVASQVRKLLIVDFMLELQDQLVSGTGATTNINGLLSYATEFAHATYANTVDEADLVDMINTIQRQIIQLGKDKYKANTGFCKHKLIWDLQILKDTLGRRKFENVALTGEAPVISGVKLTSNELAGSNELVVADLNYATLFNWGGIELKFMQIDDDELKQLVTISVDARMNLLVKPTDVNAIVKVSNYTTALAAINNTGA